MKVIFQPDNSGEKLVYVCGWNTAKKLLDIIWNEFTIEDFDRGLKKDELSKQRTIKRK